MKFLHGNIFGLHAGSHNTHAIPSPIYPYNNHHKMFPNETLSMQGWVTVPWNKHLVKLSQVLLTELRPTSNYYLVCKIDYWKMSCEVAFLICDTGQIVVLQSYVLARVITDFRQDMGKQC